MSWRKVKLGELVDNVSIRAKDIGGANNLSFFGVSNEFGIIKTKYAAESKAEDYKIIEKGCFAYNPYRVNVGSIGLVDNELKGLISPAYVVFKPKPNSIIPELLFKFLKSDEGLRQIKFFARGTVRQALRFDDLCNIELAIPNYNEQEKLFNKLQIAQKQSNLLDAEITFQISLLKQIRQRLVQDAIQGKLVKQNKNEELASKLLQKIKTEKEKLIATKKIRKEKNLPPIKMDEIPFEIPKNWVWCRLGDITTLITDGKHGDAMDQNNSGYYFLSAKDIQNGKFTYENARQITYDDFYETHRRTNLEPGDLCVVNTGATIGKTAFAPDNELTRKTTFQKSVAVLKVLNHLTSMKFIEYFIINETPKLLKTSRGSAINNLLLGDMKTVLLPLPPLSEQLRIVNKIESVLNSCAELEESIRKSKIENEKLLQQFLKEALRSDVGYINRETIIPEEKHFLKRKILATYIINQSLTDTKFGDVKFEKLLHLSDYFAIKRNLGQKYFQQAAGPYDNAFTNAYFNQIATAKWFKRTKNGRQFVFSPGQNHDKSKNTYDYFSKEEFNRVNEIITYFKKYDYEQPEIVSTLYAVWNNRIINKQEIKDHLLITDFYAWDKQKKKYEETRLKKALQWMKDKEFVPDGWGKVIEKAKRNKK